MTYLAREVTRRGGPALEPQFYKRLYLERLLARANRRLADLHAGRVGTADLTVPGIFEFLAALHRRGVVCHLASGTEKEDVVAETALLGLADYFEDRIHGPKDGDPPFSKKMVIQGILQDYNLPHCALVSIGDGKVEIEYTAEAGGLGIGLASNEAERQGINEFKREQLIRAGAGVIIPDFREGEMLLNYLTGEDGPVR
jgi:phosphoglycolate phosphatase-like HAD superfamily hydrolase